MSKEQIEQWKKQFPKSKIMEFRVPSRDFTCIIRTPDRSILVQHAKASLNPEKQYNILINNCVLTNLEQVQEDDNLFFGILNKLATYLPEVEVEAVEL